jgi:hypothetical protein
MNSTFLDKEMPVNTNKHFFNQFLRGVFSICICSNSFNENSPNFAKDIIDNVPIPANIIYFDTIDAKLLEYHCFNTNTKAIYHFLSKELKGSFYDDYVNVDQRINFNEFKFDEDQVSHLKYRCEDIFHSIQNSDIKKAKLRKVNLELLQSKKMADFFQSHPDEKLKIVNSIQENTVKNFKPSSAYLPAYLIHQNQNQISKAIQNNYGHVTKSNGRRRKGKGKMELYFEGLDKNDGTSEQIKF